MVCGAQGKRLRETYDQAQHHLTKNKRSQKQVRKNTTPLCGKHCNMTTEQRRAGRPASSTTRAGPTTCDRRNRATVFDWAQPESTLHPYRVSAAIKGVRKSVFFACHKNTTNFVRLLRSKCRFTGANPLGGEQQQVAHLVLNSLPLCRSRENRPEPLLVLEDPAFARTRLVMSTKKTRQRSTLQPLGWCTGVATSLRRAGYFGRSGGSTVISTARIAKSEQQ